MEQAIAAAKAGEMNPEVFKKLMPDSAARLRGNFDRSVSNALFDQIYATIQSQLKHPDLMKKNLEFLWEGETSTHPLESILTLVSIQVGAVFEPEAETRERVLKRFMWNIGLKQSIFPIGGKVIDGIYFPAFVKTAYECQEEIEVDLSTQKLSDVCTKHDGKKGFKNELINS